MFLVVRLIAGFLINFVWFRLLGLEINNATELNLDLRLVPFALLVRLVASSFV